MPDCCACCGCRGIQGAVGTGFLRLTLRLPLPYSEVFGLGRDDGGLPAAPESYGKVEEDVEPATGDPLAALRGRPAADELGVLRRVGAALVAADDDVVARRPLER